MNWDTHTLCDNCHKPTEKVTAVLIRVRVYRGPSLEVWCRDCYCQPDDRPLFTVIDLSQ